MNHFEIAYRDTKNVLHKACVTASNVSEAVCIATEQEPALRGRVDAIQSCTRVNP